MSSVAVALAITDWEEKKILECLTALPCVKAIAVAAPIDVSSRAQKAHQLKVESLRSSSAVVEVLRWFDTAGADYLLWGLSSRFQLTDAGLKRLLAVAMDTRSALLYSDYFDEDADGTIALHPLVRYQAGSIRDDFDFGHFVLFCRDVIAGMASSMEADGATAGEFGGFYELRLRVCESGNVFHLAEPTYSVRAADEHSAVEAHFNYVDPRNRNYQIEMESIATAHLKRIGAWLAPPYAKLVDDNSAFPVESSIVIPVRNRERTVADAVESALSQRANFSFNVIVVDNHSTDNTTAVLADIAAKDSRLVHIIPERRDQGIGGCWNEAIYSPACGRYAVQLDSDDLYASPDVLARIVAEFHSGQFAAVIGSYTIVDFQLNEIPPGLIDHREWTPDNGHNNALRIGGLGAPRAFHVPTLRTVGFPNVSFGEDYAVALRLSREYRIGRIYDSLYWCRRWEGNTDHKLPLEIRNRYSYYKDQVRTVEISARQQLVNSR